MNQHEAAQLLGITDVFLSQLVNGHRQPGLANAISIERHTGISVESWLLTEISNPDPVGAGATSKLKIAGR